MDFKKKLKPFKDVDGDAIYCLGGELQYYCAWREVNLSSRSGPTFFKFIFLFFLCLLSISENPESFYNGSFSD